MLFCENCGKDVVIYSCMYSADVEENLEKMTKTLEKEGKLILYNPPPIGPHPCPVCQKLLEEKS